MSAVLTNLYLEPIKDKMGKVTTAVTLVNSIDQIRASEGLIDASEVRAIALHDVLVDTGAFLLCLPTDIIQLLGLPFKREAFALTAAGRRPTRIYSHVELTVCGRSTIQE